MKTLSINVYFIEINPSSFSYCPIQFHFVYIEVFCMASITFGAENKEYYFHSLFWKKECTLQITCPIKYQTRVIIELNTFESKCIMVPGLRNSWKGLNIDWCLPSKCPPLRSKRNHQSITSFITIYATIEPIFLYLLLKIPCNHYWASILGLLFTGTV